MLTDILAGEHPVDTKHVARELRVSGDVGRDEGSIREIQQGKRTGLYDLVLGKGQNVLRGKGKHVKVRFRIVLGLRTGLRD
jgi:hypothetical protein